jgi:hypothetical protein
MARMFDDPLLGIARALILLCMFLVGAGVALCLLGIPVALIGPDLLMDALAEELSAPPSRATLWAAAGLLALTAALLALLVLFLRHMKRIIDTVAEGDPFIPANAERLRSMAWLMLGIQLIALPVGALESYIQQSLEGEADSLSFEFDLNSLALILVLFILARVFRRGAEMRDDLEGTV